MTTMLKRSRLLAAVLAACVMMACSPMKDPAEAALKDATAALQKVAPEGEKYAPELYATVKEQVDTMKAAFDKEDYQTVMNMVSRLAPNLKMMAQTVQNKRGEAIIKAREQWTALSGSLPKSLASVEAKVAELTKTHKLPKGVSKDALAAAPAAVDAVKQGWSDAQSAQSGGNVEDATAKALAADAKLAELMTSLGMEKPAAATK